MDDEGKKLENVVEEGLKQMEEERLKQEEEDRAKLSIKVVSTLLEIMNEEQRGAYDNITPEEGSAIIESLEKRYPALHIEYDPGFLFWGNLFLYGYETFTVDFLDKIIKLEPTEVKLFFKGLYDIYVGSVQEKLDLICNIVKSYDEGKIEDTIKELKDALKEMEENTEEEIIEEEEE